jgi:hypothetical protein
VPASQTFLRANDEQAVESLQLGEVWLLIYQKMSE